MRDCPTSGAGEALKTGRQEIPGSNPGHACRPSLSEFSVFFSETRVNTGYNPLERSPLEGNFANSPISFERQLDLHNHPTNQSILRNLAVPKRIFIKFVVSFFFRSKGSQRSAFAHGLCYVTTMS